MVGIVLISLSSYCFYAINSFKTDKEAYIFSIVGETSENLASDVSSLTEKVIKDSFLIGGLLNKSKENKDLSENILKNDQDLIEFTLQKINDESKTKTEDNSKSTINENEQLPLDNENSQLPPNQDQISPKRFEFSYISDNWRSKIEGLNFVNFVSEGKGEFLEKLKKKKVLLVNSSKGQNNILSFYLFNSNENEYYIYRLSSDKILKKFNKSSEVQNKLLSTKGKVLLHRDKAFIRSQKSDPEFKDLKFLLELPGVSGTSEILKNNLGKYLISFTKIKNLDLVVFSEISKDKAFLSLEKLIKDSIVFAIMLVMFTFIFALILAKSLSKPLGQLVVGTNRIAKGDFETPTVINSKDEIGVLSDSFNFMQKEIIRYMDEVKEGARMANELAVAKLVQDAFFPSNHESFDNLEVAGFYQSASECGGDWWGFKEIDGRLILFVGDATGHGVPAALVTATANCCAHILEDLAEKDPSILDSPGKMMEIFNKVVYKVGGKILMTFFIASFDLKTMKMTYANASHNPPYHLQYKGLEEFEKGDMEILLCENGTRLGHKEEASYGEADVQLNSGDVLVFCSDGIVEGENPEKKMYGERRFMKSIIKNGSKQPVMANKAILKDAFDFFSGEPPNDDITLVTVKVK